MSLTPYDLTSSKVCVEAGVDYRVNCTVGISDVRRKKLELGIPGRQLKTHIRAKISKNIGTVLKRDIHCRVFR